MNTIEPTYVSFEQAKWLKEKGYKSKSRYYDGSGKLVSVPNIPENDYRHTNNYMQRFRWEAPEQWQVVEWASLVHNIDIEARPVRYAGDIKTSYYQPYINGCSVNMSKFTTRQEALSEAINEFLKMI